MGLLIERLVAKLEGKEMSKIRYIINVTCTVPANEQLSNGAMEVKVESILKDGGIVSIAVVEEVGIEEESSDCGGGR